MQIHTLIQSVIAPAKAREQTAADQSLEEGIAFEDVVSGGEDTVADSLDLGAKPREGDVDPEVRQTETDNTEAMDVLVPSEEELVATEDQVAKFGASDGDGEVPLDDDIILLDDAATRKFADEQLTETILAPRVQGRVSNEPTPRPEPNAIDGRVNRVVPSTLEGVDRPVQNQTTLVSQKIEPTPPGDPQAPVVATAQGENTKPNAPQVTVQIANSAHQGTVLASVREAYINDAKDVVRSDRAFPAEFRPLNSGQVSATPVPEAAKTLVSRQADAQGQLLAATASETEVKIRAEATQQTNVAPQPTHPVQAMLFAQMPAAPAMVKAGLAAMNDLKVATIDVTQSDADFAASMERPADVRGFAPSSVTALPRQEAIQVSNQVISAMRSMQTNGQVIEVALNPAELGSVRIAMTVAETGMAVTVLADRGETLDLLRRNIVDLQDALAELGHDSVEFAFQQDGNREDQADDGSTAHVLAQSTDDDPEIVTDALTRRPPPLAHTQTGMDIRV